MVFTRGLEAEETMEGDSDPKGECIDLGSL